MRTWYRNAALALLFPLAGGAWVAAPAAQPAAATSAGAAPEVALAHISLADVTAAGGQLVAVGERGMVVHSVDGGRHWHGKAAPTTRMLTAVTFLDAQTGVAVGHGGTVLRTTDGGRNWRPVPLTEAGKDALLGLTLLHDGRLLAYGAFGLYFESADKGLTWTRRQVVAEDFDRHISKVIEAGNRLLLVGESGTLARSDDGGATWTRIESPYVGSYFGALALRDGALLIFGMRGNVFRSTDAGLSWTKVPFAATSALNGGTVGPQGQVVLVGNNGLVATSVDEGRSFTLQYGKNGTPVAQAAFADDRGLVFVGYMNSGRVERPEPRVTTRQSVAQEEKS